MADQGRFVAGASANHEHDVGWFDVGQLDQLAGIPRRPQGPALGCLDLKLGIGNGFAGSRHERFPRRFQESRDDFRFGDIIRPDLAVHHDFTGFFVVHLDSLTGLL